MRGDDGLTWLGRKYRAWRWRRTGGRKPTRREMLRLCMHHKDPVLNLDERL